MNSKKLTLSIILVIGTLTYLYPNLKALYSAISDYLALLPYGWGHIMYGILRDAVIPIVGAFVVVAVILALIWAPDQNAVKEVTAEKAEKPPFLASLVGAVFAAADASLFILFLLGYDPFYMFVGGLVCACLLSISVVRVAKHYALGHGGYVAVAPIFLLSVIEPITQYVTSQVSVVVSLSLRCVAVLISCVALYDVLSDFADTAKTRLFTASSILFLLAGLTYLFSALFAFINLSLLVGFDTSFVEWAFMGLLFASWIILATTILTRPFRHSPN